MIDFIRETINSLYDFFVFGVFVYILKKKAADKVLEKLENPRRLAVWKHYVGSGHAAEDVRDCREGECNVLRTARPVPAVQSTSQLA